MNLKDVCKVVSFLSELVEKDKTIEPASEASVHIVGTYLKHLGFDKLSENDVEYSHRHAVSFDRKEALNLIDELSLVVVVDTFKQDLTEAPSVLDESERIAVIDHHRKGADFIQDTVLSYSETFASSTSEIMVEIMSYLASDMAIFI